MKKICITAIFALAMTLGNGIVQAQKFAPIDKSPVDIAYFPVSSSMEGKAPLIKVVYSRPFKNGREIFGKLEKFGEVWRAGANEETEIRFYKDAMVAGTRVPAGNYSLFVIPEKDSWTFIINKQNDQWGAYTYDKAMDVVRAKVAVKAPASAIENFSITFMEENATTNLVAGWDNSMAMLPIKF